MCDPKTFTLEVTAEELVLIEIALLGSARAQEYNDALFSLLQRVHSLRPLPFAASPMPSSSICAGSTSLSQSLTRFLPESPGSSSHTTLASLGLPLDVAADQTSAEEENSDEEDQLINDDSEVVDSAEEEDLNTDQEIDDNSESEVINSFFQDSICPEEKMGYNEDGAGIDIVHRQKDRANGSVATKISAFKSKAAKPIATKRQHPYVRMDDNGPHLKARGDGSNHAPFVPAPFNPNCPQNGRPLAAPAAWQAQ
ncbi:hypothetical protein M405DRAFT_869895, partial [Rhizopogon salebrosus TDB-379]